MKSVLDRQWYYPNSQSSSSRVSRRTMLSLPNVNVVSHWRYSLPVLIYTAGCLVEILNAKEAAATYLRPAVERSGHRNTWHLPRNRQSEPMREDVLCVRWSSTQLDAPIVRLIIPHAADRHSSVLATISDATPHYRQSSATLVNTSTFTTPNIASEQEISCQRHINSSKQSAVLLLTNHSECHGARISCGDLLASQHSGIVEVLTATPVFAVNATSNVSANRSTSLVCSEGFALTSITALRNGSFGYECTAVEYSDSNPSSCVKIEVLDVVLQFSFYTAVLAVVVTILIIVISIDFLDPGGVQYKQRQFQLAIRLGVFISLLLLFVSESVTASQSSSSRACWIATVIGHYAVVAFCAWCVLEGYALHQQVVNVFSEPPSHFVAKCIGIGQGLPLVAVLLSTLLIFVGSDYDSPGRERCSLHDNRLAMYVILLPVVLTFFLVNISVYVEVMWLITKLPRKGSEKRQTIIRRAKGSLAVFFILGLGWLPTYILSFWDCLGLGGLYICPIIALLAQASIVLTYHITSELPSLKKFCRAVRMRLHAQRRPPRASFGNSSRSHGAPSSPSRSSVAAAGSPTCSVGKSPPLVTDNNGMHVTATKQSVTAATYFDSSI